MSETGIDSGSISSHEGSKSNMDNVIIRNPRHQQFLHPSIESGRVVVILYSRDSNYEAYNYYIVAGETC